MESLKQALTMGITGAIAVFTASYFGLPTWVLFMAWVSYYLFGTKTKTTFLVLVQQIFGILIAMIIQYLGTLLSETLAIFGFPIIVFIVMIGVFYISKLKYLNNILAYFLGMIIGFGSNSEIDINILLLLGITLLSGYTFAWLNVTISKRIESK
ncbi:DUF1097 domain-containing protein [Psychroserpens ponticola]|uniref:DUF1097 domain-containing protein n=1 Tax=Psychroserpens ponticola TaxID=2932268 RepID=A0ABY7RZI5_9FLAO|nr:DUF1097 domain-containing protein [Psychroserpens ponticola]WCO02293.1 DUF1097 domain-containing protein [Psychroserpens ponticola]